MRHQLSFQLDFKCGVREMRDQIWRNLFFALVIGNGVLLQDIAVAQPPADAAEAPATSVKEWRAQLDTSLAEITQVDVAETATGLTVTLQTSEGPLDSPSIRTAGNDWIAEIPNAVLANGQSLTQETPAPDLAKITITQTTATQVTITITGIEAAPEVALATQSQGFTLAITPVLAEAETEVIVTASRTQEGYTVPNATTATRTDTPLRDIPQSIQVVPKEVIEDQQVIRLDDALRNVSGVVQNSADPRGQRFQIRGFDSASVIRNGFPQTFGFTGNSAFQDLTNVEQIEVLKGPAAILFGVSEPGGVINLVTKKPLSEPFVDLEVKAGNRNLISPSIDLSGPLTEDGSILYRLNASYRREDSDRNFDTPIERFFVAPVLQFKLGERTDFTVELEYIDDTRPGDFGLVAIGNRVADIPFETNLGELDDRLEAESIRAGYQFEHRFSDQWKIRNAFNYKTYDSRFASFFRLGFDEASGTLFRAFIDLDQPSTTYEMQTTLTGEFETGPIGHKLLIGLDLNRRDAVGNIGRGDFGAAAPFNIFNPVYGVIPRPNPENDPIFFDGDTRAERLGVFLQDQITLLDNLKLLAGIRYDTVRQTSTNRPSFFNPTSSTTEQTDDAFTPRLGLIYQPIEEISLYGSFSRSFNPNSATTVAGGILDPERGEQFEIGARGELLDGRLVTSLALFTISKTNVATSDPNNPLFSVNSGSQRNRGLEFDIAGELLPGWNLIANYAYIDSEITAANDPTQGNRIFNVPEHNFNLWTNYEIQTGSLRGLGFGIGFNFVSDRFGDNANSFILEDYFLTNAAISFKRDGWKAAINFRNIFDVDYIQGGEGSRTNEIYPGDGFTVIGSVSVEL